MVKENGVPQRDDRFLNHCEESRPRTTTGAIKNKASEGVSKPSYINLHEASSDEHTFHLRREAKRDRPQAIRTTACNIQDFRQYEHHQGTT
jgi:hypothetical protein